jgi:hypothetical protein
MKLNPIKELLAAKTSVAWLCLFEREILFASMIGIVMASLVQRVQAAEEPRSLTEDAAILCRAGGAKWKTDVLKLKVRDGKEVEQLLIIEFAPGAQKDQAKPIHAKAKLALATPPVGIFKVNSSLGDASFRDVRLQERNGIRTMTITRAPDTLARVTEKTQAKLDRYWSVSFPYELKGDQLTLKNVPKDRLVNWGVTEFIAPRRRSHFVLPNRVPKSDLVVL